ncbi:MAG TPA: DUF885 domain-containing protein [Gemmatimonadales bacterium]|nr:DUF885 domain-containing protein [Gemmatimonadales bacterium]
MRLSATLAAAALVGCGRSTPSAPEPAAGPAARVRAIADEYLAARLQAFPELGTQFGIPGARHDRLRDVSAAGERAWQAHEDRFRAELREVDPAKLRDTPEWVLDGLLREELEASARLRVCRNRLWTVHPLTGWQATYAALASVQPVGTEELRRETLARWRALPALIDGEIANLREGVRLGYTAPKVNVERVLAGMDRLVEMPAADLPFAGPANRDSTPAFRAELLEVITSGIAPAMRRYRDYLRDEYLGVAREAIAVTANPNGTECYRAAIRRYTTLDLSGDEIHEMGLRQVRAAESAMVALARRSYGTDDPRALMRKLEQDPKETFAARSEVIPAIDTVLERAWRAVPKAFGIIPRSRVAVEPFPQFQEPSVPLGQYLRAALDGSRPGIYRVNLYLATKPGARLDIARLTFHEGVPGHHFQLAIAQERSGVHPLTRYLSNSAFAEGWGIYAERVADELGLYSSDAERLNDLEGLVYGYSTLVMETGMHVKGWSRQQAIDFELAHTTRTPEQAALDVDRRIGWPGQGLSYMLGFLEIQRLRGEAEQALGSRFDLREFHDRVLEDGVLTLPMLGQKVERWIAQRGSGASPVSAGAGAP